MLQEQLTCRKQSCDPGVVSIAHRALGAGACATLMLKLEAMLLDDRLHGSRHTQGQPAFVKQGSEAYLVVKSEAVKQEKERI